MDYLEVKGFWDPSTYSLEKGYLGILRNFGTHCRLRESRLPTPYGHGGDEFTQPMSHIFNRLINNYDYDQYPTTEC